MITPSVTQNRTPEYLQSLLTELCNLPSETEWLEFKVNDAEPDSIGEYLSALSNSAALEGKSSAYVVWGVDDDTHTVVGTSFRPTKTKVGNEELENWLLKLLAPKINFRFHEFTVDGKPVVILEIDEAFRHPTQFKGNEYLRVGTYTKKLKDFPEKERALWRYFDKTPFEAGIAAERLTAEAVLSRLDTATYFKLLEQPSPATDEEILAIFEEEGLIARGEAGGWDITNMGAILFAKRLEEYPSLRRKATRVIRYRGNNKIGTLGEQVGVRGYASGFEGMMTYLNSILPSSEVIAADGLRRTVRVYPDLAVRELVANALIHQDFLVTGAGPMIEVFDDRVEVVNPGHPLVETLRFVNSPPQSRNEALASLMRRLGICEERGTGWDKVVFETEIHQLPAPLAEATEEATRAVLFGPKDFSSMDKADKLRAIYWHACLRYVSGEYLTNQSLRERLGIADHNKSAASRLIREALDAQLIAADDPEAAPKLMRYVPIWARRQLMGS